MSSPPPQRLPATRSASLHAPNILCVDVGGSHVKAAIVAADATLLSEPARIATPTGDGPQALLDAIAALVAPLLSPAARAGRVAIGFPGALRDDLVLTAPNLAPPDRAHQWRRVPLADLLAERLGLPVRMANDATVQGLGAIAGRGLECAITLGTGMGFALFQHGAPAPQLELGQHLAHKSKSYDAYVGDRALKKHGHGRWNRRVGKVIRRLRALVHYDRLYIGGGNARHIDFAVPADVHLVSNETGILGGIRLWHGFTAEPAA